MAAWPATVVARMRKPSSPTRASGSDQPSAVMAAEVAGVPTMMAPSARGAGAVGTSAPNRRRNPSCNSADEIRPVCESEETTMTVAARR